MSGIIEKIARLGVLPVISVSQPEWALPLADALLAGGLSALEVTLRSDAALTALSRIHAERPQMTLCAGTGNLIWATLGSLLFPLYKKYAKAINAVMALLLVWCAWKIVKT